ncbi:MAG: SpoIIE family protein phosphatase, partial [Candidatus Tyrphobacter sp.]
MDSRFPIVIFWGPDLVQFYNDAYAAAILRDKHPALGRRAQDCWSEIWPVIGPLLDSVMRGGRATYSENLYLPVITGGVPEERYFTFSYSPIRTETGIGGVFCAVTETTAIILRERDAEERATALADLDRAKTSFFSNVSHEFRTPLTLMLGPLEELAKTVNAEQLPLVSAARRNSLRLLKLVNTLLRFSRLEAGQADAVFTETDLAPITRELAGVFRSAIESSGLNLIVDADPDARAFVDLSMWEVIMLNLLSNALKFTLDGAIHVSLRSTADAVTLTVTDSGVGISPEDLPHVFERFRRVHAVKARSQEGSGIGLALVNELVRLHGGAIRVQSEVGKGTTFEISLPLGKAHLDPSALLPAPVSTARSTSAEQYLAEVEATIAPAKAALPQRSIGSSRGTCSRVLLADDNHDLREYVSRILSPTFDVIAVNNGREALQTAQRERVDLIISDVMMPEMDGFELLKAVRSNSDLQTTPFIMLSARTGEETAIEGLTRGADDYIAKPFSAEHLLARVRSHTRGAQLRREEQEFRQLVESGPVIRWIADASGAITWYNRPWYEYTGQTREESAGWGWQVAHHPKDLPGFLQEWNRCIATRTPFQKESRLRKSDGTFRTMLAQAVPTRDESGQVTRWYGSSIDIEAQKAAQQRSKHVAETLQTIFLPRKLPHTKQLRVDAIYQAAEKDAHVGGDWYDAVRLADGRYRISIGDVIGHGLHASIMSWRLRHAVDDFAFNYDSPAAILREVNRVMRFEFPESYATALIAVIDPTCSTLTYASAGHPPPIIAGRDRPAQALPRGGLLLGIVDNLELVSQTAAIARDDAAIFYTDGMTEFARDSE